MSAVTVIPASASSSSVVIKPSAIYTPRVTIAEKLTGSSAEVLVSSTVPVEVYLTFFQKSSPASKMLAAVEVGGVVIGDIALPSQLTVQAGSTSFILPATKKFKVRVEEGEIAELEASYCFLE